MLVYFSAENFRSIKEPIELDLRAAPRLRRLANHVRQPIADKTLKVLKSAVLYGANASGKSNIFKAIHFAQQLIIGQTIANKPIKCDPFTLSDEVASDSSFYFEFVILEQHFGFGAKFNQTQIIEESLNLLSKDTETCIYSRTLQSGEAYDIQSELIYSDDVSDEQQKEFEYLIKYTPKNKLFITECQDRGGVDKFELLGAYVRGAHAFFKHFLQVIFPDTKYAGLLPALTGKDQSADELIQLLQNFDTGVNDIQPVAVELALFSEEFIAALQSELEDTAKTSLSFHYQNKEYQLTLSAEGELSAVSLNAVHHLPSGSKIEFDLSNESDGTLRLLDLLPAIRNNPSDKMNRTFMIDEFDRSLHPNLAKSYLQLFLNSDYADNNNQMIVTTHEAELLDNDLLRRDEIWFVQKEWDASSRLYSLNDYTTRFDTDIHKAYLAGRFGAIPLIMKKFNK